MACTHSLSFTSLALKFSKEYVKVKEMDLITEKISFVPIGSTYDKTCINSIYTVLYVHAYNIEYGLYVENTVGVSKYMYQVIGEQ